MAKQAVDFSTPMAELLGGGGQIFNPGMYRVVESDFRTYDFKKPNNDTLCAYQKLQPVDADGNDEGDEVERYWPLNAQMRDGSVVIEAITPVKGRKGSFSQITFTAANTHGKIYGASPFGVFLSHCEKAEVDMDAIGNDFSAFEGSVYEYGLFNKPERKRTAVEEAEGDGDKKPSYPKQEVVIVSVPDKKSKKTAPKAKKEEEDEEEAPKVKSKAKAKKSDPETADEWCKAYLEAEVCTDDNEADGVSHTNHKLNLPKWLNKRDVEPAMVKKVMVIYNDVEDELPALLETMGWEYKAKTKEIVKG